MSPPCFSGDIQELRLPRYIITVPTPVDDDNNPDLSMMRAARSRWALYS